MHKTQEKLNKIILDSSKDEFIFDFLLAYNTPKSTIARLKKWDLNKLEEKWELLLRKKISYKYVSQDLYAEIDAIKNELKNNRSKPRFIIVTDFNKFLAYDTKVHDSLDIDFNTLGKHYDFFNPLLGIEKKQFHNETVADRKAAENLAKLYDEIVKDNEHSTHEKRHALNIFLSRLLFCYFAEDTNIFKVNQFTNSLASHTKLDGSDTHIFLENLFEVFNSKDKNNALAEYLNEFPYVNGKLFEDTYAIPKFTTRSRKLLIDLWELDWSGINPDIFGSMMQAVMDSEERANLGSHFTSVSNIMKVINPLFLDELKEELEESIWNTKKLNALLGRISNIKFFDPACWSGNFLIIAYKEIRRLEIEILQEVWFAWAFGWGSSISLSQFYWIELHDFAHETAKLSLYLAEHQMNVEFYNEVKIKINSLPLKLWWNIVCWNATRIDWEEVCPKEEWDEIYIMWNPPYLWARLQDAEQKKDMAIALWSLKWKNNLDYISAWFYKGAKFMKNSNIKSAFVTTNSINQWEQVALLWPTIFDFWLEIDFCYSWFKWDNNAKWNAKVIVVIIWLRNISNDKKYIYKDNLQHEVSNINWYLVDSKNIFIENRTKSISGFPKMSFWNMALDWWNLILSTKEKDQLVNEYPATKELIRELVWSQEYIQWKQRWCLWIDSEKLLNAKQNPIIKNRIALVEKTRLASKDKWANKLAAKSHQFREMHEWVNGAIIMPRVSSERRKYIPWGYLTNDKIISDSAQAIYDWEKWLLWVLISNMHMVWMKSVAWRLKTDYRYSKNIVYNNFPFPRITKKQKEEIEWYVYEVLDEREKHSEKTLAEVYAPDKMPERLKIAHHELDLAIERCYRPKPFESDEERLEYLFKMYEKMIAKEKADTKK